MHLIRTSLQGIRARARNERAFTMAEVLVTILLTAVVIGTVTAVVLTTRDAAGKFSQQASSQEAITTTVASISRELSVAPVVTVADDYHLEFTNSKGEQFRYFYYDPENPLFDLSEGIAGVPPIEVPAVDKPSLVEMRTFQDTEDSVVSVLVTPVNLTQEKSGLPLFTYYNSTNQILDTPVVGEELAAITRVAIRIVSSSSDIVAKELATSVSMKRADVSEHGVIVQHEDVITDDDDEEEPPPPPPALGTTVLTGTLTPGQRNAILSWTAADNATGYTLKRDGATIATLPATTRTYTDSTRPWGADQTYQVTALGVESQSSVSNEVKLRVVPEKPAFNTTNSKANGRNNVLAWAARSGATQYKVYRDGTANPICTVNSGSTLTCTDANRGYGTKATYRVVASNPVLTSTHGGTSGGNSATSDPITLISPPANPVVSIQDYKSHPSTRDGNNYVFWTAPANATRYEWKIWSTGAVTSTTARNFTDRSPAWGADRNYYVRACNAAGCNASWVIVTGSQPPGPFTITINQRKRSGQSMSPSSLSHATFKNVAQRADLSWTAASGASTYDIYRGSTHLNSKSGRTQNDTGFNPGSKYNYKVTATSANGLTRSATFKMHATPAPPKRLRTDFQVRTCSGDIESRNSFWGNPVQSAGSASNATPRARTFRLSGNPNKMSRHDGTSWFTWGSNSRPSNVNNMHVLSKEPKANWDKGLAGTMWKKAKITDKNAQGNMIISMNVIDVASGFSTGSTSTYGDNPPYVDENGKEYYDPRKTGYVPPGGGHRSWSAFLNYRALVSRTWGSCPNTGGTWKVVPYTSGNYPGGNSDVVTLDGY